MEKQVLEQKNKIELGPRIATNFPNYWAFCFAVFNMGPSGRKCILIEAYSYFMFHCIILTMFGSRFPFCCFRRHAVKP